MSTELWGWAARTEVSSWISEYVVAISHIPHATGLVPIPGLQGTQLPLLQYCDPAALQYACCAYSSSHCSPSLPCLPMLLPLLVRRLIISPSPASRRIQHPSNLRSRSNKRTHRTRPRNPQPTRSRFPRQPTTTRRILPIHDSPSGSYGRWCRWCWIWR